MFIPLANSPRPYAWGSHTAIAELLGTEPSGEPEAEIWFGAHAGSPSRILDPAAVGGHPSLDAWIAAEPVAALGRDRSRLPFLLKVLAAAGPLSLQAHPSSGLAAAGFERENALGIPVDAPDRNYRDTFHKPELVFVLSDEFHALCGFRLLEETQAVLVDLAGPEGSGAIDDLRTRLSASGAKTSLRETVRWLLTSNVDELIAEVLDRAAARREASPYAVEYDTILDLGRRFPGDPGIVVALLLNRVTLRRGQALYLPAGNIHAYLDGLGLELMAASDNVLRGGLTTKHIDVPELLNVLEFDPIPVPYLEPVRQGARGELYDPDVPDFSLVRVSGEELDDVVGVPGPAIALVTEGEFRVRGAHSVATLRRGDALYITPDEARLQLTGAGEFFLATVGQ